MNPSSNYKNDGFEDDTYLVNFKAGPSTDSSLPRSRSSASPNFNVRYNDSRSHMIIDAPASHLEKVKNADGTISVTRETKHFCETTTMHGPKRIFKGKRWAHLFWGIMVAGSLGLLILQVVILVKQYLSEPIISQVSFLIDDEGKDFPLVTFCNLNPIRKSYVDGMNKTGDVHPEMLNYLMYYNTEIQSLFGGVGRQNLHEGNESLQVYQNSHPGFTADGFFNDAGFECQEIFKICSFEGEQFDCCSIASPILTPLGKCYTLDMSKSVKDSMHKQSEPGILAGLQVTLDAHLEEQFDETADGVPPLFTNSFVDGFRYFVHPKDTVPHLASDEFTVSPDMVAYSAMSSDRFVLLPADQWGNCTETYPSDIKTELPYAASNCLSLCKAKHFVDVCGCTPSIYNLENKYPECTPFDTYICVDTKMRKKNDKGYWDLILPSCTDCNVECNRLVYRAYNSYGNKFSKGALNWLNQKNSSWTSSHIRANFQIVNVYFRDMSYTEYNQVQDASITKLLSEIGGNMGMFLGMSVITITEISLYFSKVLWIAVSKNRRNYMYSKKISEKTHEKDVDETVEKMKVIGSTANLQELARIQSCGHLKDPNDNDRIQFRINIQDLADQINNDSGYIRTDIDRSRSTTAKY